MALRQVDVAIAGAGVGGAALALALVQNGFSVALVEQAARFSPIYRGEFLQPKSLEILYNLGLQREIEAVTVRVEQTRLRTDDGQIEGLVDYRRLSGPIREGRNGHHRAIQSAILKALSRYESAELLMGTRVTGLLPQDSGSEGPPCPVGGLQTTRGPIRARLTVGADGQYSAVRRHLGLPFKTFRYPGEPLAVTVTLPEPYPPAVDFVFGQGESALLFPLPNRQARLYLIIPDRVYEKMKGEPDEGLTLLKDRLATLLPYLKAPIAAIASMRSVQRVPCWYLRAPTWVADGAALLGDAVHAVSPTRGQGMNLAIQDGAALADLFGRLPRTGSPTARDLMPYQRLRQPQADFIQNDAGRTHRLLLASGPIARLARTLSFGTLGRAPEVMAAILGMYAGTVRPPRWYDHLFVSAALALPALDPWVARVWGRRLGPAEW